MSTPEHPAERSADRSWEKGATDGVLCFGPFAFDVAASRLSRDGVEIHLTPKAALVLGLLLQRPGELISKDDFLEAVWEGVHVREESLTQAISVIRQTLGDSAQSPRYIQTVSGEGYRFIGDVDHAAVAPAHQRRSPGETTFADVASRPARDDGSGEPQPPVQRSATGQTPISVRIGIAALVVATIVVVSGWLMTRPDRRDVERTLIPLPVGEELLDFAVSADETLVYAAGPRTGESRLYRRDISQLEAEAVPGTGGACIAFFLPDGESVVFARNLTRRRLEQVRLSGGPSMPFAQVPAAVRGAYREESGSLLLGVHVGQMVRLPAGEETPEAVLPPGVDAGIPQRFPQPLPDGRGLLFTVGGFERHPGEIWVLPREAEQPRHLGLGAQARYLPTGHVVFVRGDSLWAAPFDLDNLELTADPVPIINDIAGVDVWGMSFAWTDDGTLYYAEKSPARDRSLLWVDRQGNATKVAAPPGRYEAPELSPEGGALLVRKDAEIWLLDLSRNSAPGEPLTASDESAWTATFSPDGGEVVVAHLRAARPAVVSRVRLSGTRSPETLPLNTLGVRDWSRHGVLHSSQEGLGLWRFETRASEPLVAGPGRIVAADVSPDGEHLAYIIVDDQRGYLRIRGLVDEKQVGSLVVASEQLRPVNPSQSLRWSRTGTELFYRAGPDMMAVPVHRRTEGVDIGEAEKLFEASAYLPEFDVAPDGSFLMIREDTSAATPQPDRIVRVKNWFEELKRSVPAGRSNQ